MSEKSLIALAESLRDRELAFLEQVRGGSIPDLSELEVQAERGQELVGRLTQLESRVHVAVEAICHGLNNLLMAVQTAHDHLGRNPDTAGMLRLRDRLAEMSGRLQRTQRDLLALLSSLMSDPSDVPDDPDQSV